MCTFAGLCITGKQIMERKVAALSEDIVRGTVNEAKGSGDS